MSNPNVPDLDTRIAQLEDRIETLEESNNILRERIEELEASERSSFTAEQYPDFD